MCRVPFGVSMIAFGGFSWALDGAACPCRRGSANGCETVMLLPAR